LGSGKCYVCALLDAFLHHRGQTGGRWEMASSERLILDVAEMAADGLNHTDRVFRGRFELSDARAGARDAIATSHVLLTEIDTVLANGSKVLIESYYRRRL
jgi:hypothetical protein